MAQEASRTIVLKILGTVTASATGNEVVNVGRFTAARIRLKSDAGTGTSPTLDVYIQNGIRTTAAADLEANDATGALAWNDFVHFAQVTTAASEQYASIVAGSNFINVAQDVALAANTVRSGPLGDRWRVKMVVAGTTPSFANVSVVAEMLP